MKNLNRFTILFISQCQPSIFKPHDNVSRPMHIRYAKCRPNVMINIVVEFEFKLKTIEVVCSCDRQSCRPQLKSMSVPYVQGSSNDDVNLF